MAKAHTLIACFPAAGDAYDAVHRLDDAGVPPEHVDIVAADKSLAGEEGGRSYAAWGAVGGFVLGLGVIAAAVAIGGPQMLNPVGLVIGGGGMSIGLGFIGFVFGRGLVRRPRNWRAYESCVEHGGGVVAVSCTGAECDLARETLRDAGAGAIEEEGPA